MDVYLQRKSATPRLGLILALVALAVATGLAASMTSRRSGLPDHATRVQPAGWRVSFQPPEGWRKVTTSTDGDTISAIEFAPLDVNGHRTTILVDYEEFAGSVSPLEALDHRQKRRGLSGIFRLFTRAAAAGTPKLEPVGELDGASLTWAVNDSFVAIVVGTLPLGPGGTGVVTIDVYSQDGSPGRAMALARFVADTVQVED